MKSSSKSWRKWIPFAAALASGVALRLLFYVKYPSGSEDGTVYEALGRNWFAHGTYGFEMAGRLIPSDIRVPGYPAFTAFFHLFGRGETALLLAQAAMDLCTCVLAGILAGILVPASQSSQTRRRVQIAAVWLAALCPFLADYAAVNLTEVLATFLTAIALVALVAACVGTETLSWSFLLHGVGGDSPARGSASTFLRGSWFVGGLAVGCGTMVRPETPLILVAVGFVLLLPVETARRLAKINSRGRVNRRGLHDSVDSVDGAQRNFFARISAAGATLRAKSR